MDLTTDQSPIRSDAKDLALLHALQDGLPLVARPYAVLGSRLGMSEGEVLARIWLLRERGIIKRFGVVVRHHELGYRANAMVVWDVPDDLVDEAGSDLGAVPYVTLCYRRPRRLPSWPYNLFTMIHGRDRAQVLERVDELVEVCDLEDIRYQVLFSRRRFKQRGARYDDPTEPAASLSREAGT
jgi:DNA-binding Lrp family transcriptional regulator